jgi:hypothetical protein
MCRFWNITPNNFCISFPPTHVWPSKHVQSNYFRCARSSIFNAWIISTLHAWTLNDDEEFSALLCTEFEVLLAWRMYIRRLRWKALQTLWTVSRMTFLRPACCKTLPVSLSYSDRRLMYCPAGIVCPYTELALLCSIGEQKLVVCNRKISTKCLLVMVCFISDKFFVLKGNIWLDKQFQKGWKKSSD